MKNYIIFLFITCFSAGVLHSQYYEYGQDPASLKWSQMESPSFKLIFPEGYEKEANRTLYILEKNKKANGEQLEFQPSKVQIILHNQTVRSNGFVSWAPKRSEFFTHADVNPISQDWISHLALHEYRHVIQIEKLKMVSLRMNLNYLLKNHQFIN